MDVAKIFNDFEVVYCFMCFMRGGVISHNPSMTKHDAGALPPGAASDSAKPPDDKTLCCEVPWLERTCFPVLFNSTESIRSSERRQDQHLLPTFQAGPDSEAGLRQNPMWCSFKSKKVKLS